MNSNGRLQLVLAVVFSSALAMMIGQLPMQGQLRSLKDEMTQLQAQLTQQRTEVTAAHAALQRASWQSDDLADHATSRTTVSRRQRQEEFQAWIKEQRQQSYEDHSRPRAEATTTTPTSMPSPLVAEEPMQLADGSPLNEDELAAIFAGEGIPVPGPAAVSAAMVPVMPSVTTEGQDAEEPQAVNRLASKVEKGGVLLRKGKLQVEPAFSYSHTSNNRVALSGFSILDVIFIGEIRAEQIDRDIFTSSLGVRYGLTNNLQGEVELPMQYQYEQELSGPIEDRHQRKQQRMGFNDVSGGLHYQFLHENGSHPSIIASLKVKAPTGESPNLGSGVWATKAGLVMIKSSDPVALFSNIGYSINFPGQVNGVDINPGNSFEYSVGMAYALNYNLSVNSAFEQLFISESKANGAPLTGSRLVVANLKAGLTYAVSKQLSVDFSVGTGLTEDSPDVTVNLSFPYTF